MFILFKIAFIKWLINFLYISVRKKKKRRQHQAREGPPGKVKVDKGYLSSDYLIAMVGGFGLLPVLGESLPLVILFSSPSFRYLSQK